MERLTEFWDKEDKYISDVTLSDYTDDNGLFPISEEGVDKVIQKLGKYEDLEEQGLLLRLPCKFGDTVYSIANNGKIYPVKATREVRIVNGVLHIICESCKYSDLVSYDDIGKTIFLTKSEAEAKLKELRGGENE